MARLVFIDGKLMGNVAALQPANSIGRSEENSIVLDEPGVLSRHCTIVLADGRYRVTRADPGARLTLNGRPVSEETLRHGDVLAVGDVNLLFSDESAAADALRKDPEATPTEILSRSRTFADAEATLGALLGSRRPVERLEALYRVANALGATLAAGDLVDRLLAQLFAVFRPDRAFLLLADEHGRLHVQGERMSETSRRAGFVKLSRTILEEAVSRKEAVLTRSAAADARFSGGRSVADQFIQSALCAPLVRNDRVLGAIHLDTLDPQRSFDREDLELLNAVAAQAAVALDNVRAHEREAGHARSLVRLGDASRRVSSYLTREPIVQAAVEQAAAVFECRKVSVLLAGGPGEPLTVAASNCIDRPVWPAVRIRPGEGYAGRVFQEGRPLLVTDAAPGKAYESSSFAIAPLHSRGEGLKAEPSPIGVICVTDRASGGPLGPNDLELLGLFASHLGIALHNARLFERATVDTLTRLFTRHYFNFRAEEEVREHAARGAALSFLLCDLDHFKDKNDVYGHPVGDVILAEAAAVVKRHVQPPSWAARYGGEEFAVVLPGMGIEAARDLAQDIRAAVEAQEYNASSEPVRCTVSIGAAWLPPGGTLESLVKDADAALYAAKRSGRNRVEVHRR